jgi:hypothetical protein
MRERHSERPFEFPARVVQQFGVFSEAVRFQKGRIRALVFIKCGTYFFHGFFFLWRSEKRRNGETREFDARAGICQRKTADLIGFPIISPTKLHHLVTAHSVHPSISCIAAKTRLSLYTSPANPQPIVTTRQEV